MTKAHIRIVQGNYRNFDCAGRVFELVKQFTPSAKGGFVTVKNGDTFPGFPENVRIIYSGGIATLNHVEFLSTLSINGVALGNIIASREAFVLHAKNSCTGITRGVEEVLFR